MRLAFCLYKYFPYGGLQRDFLRIVQVCMRRGHEVHVYTAYWEGEQIPGLIVHLLPTRGSQNHTRLANFAESFQQSLVKESHDLVIGFNKMPYLDIYYAADVCYQSRARARHGWWYRLLPRYKQLVALEAAVFAKGAKTEVLLISPLQQKEYIRFYQTEPERFHLLPPGIAKDRLAPSNAAEIRAKWRADWQVPQDHIVLLMVGSGFKTKGLDRALIALAALPEAIKQRCHLWVIGQDHPQSFQKMANRLHIQSQVQFLGGRPDVPQFLLAADLLLHPAYHENTGTVLLEALAAGLPVLTVDVCGYAHYVEEANAGVVLPSPFSQSALNACLEKMVESLQQANWQQNGILFAKQADIFSMPEKAADLIEEIAGKTASYVIPAPAKNMLGQVRMGIYCHPTISKYFSLSPSFFDQLMGLRGQGFRHQDGRLTQRIKVGDHYYFIKQHQGVGWKEIFKNLFQGRLPILGAKNEWRALIKLQSLGVAAPQVMAYGARGWNLAKLQSFVLMEEVAPAISLETLCATWPESPPAPAFKRLLLAKIARIARLLHANGMNHRDFYICHFLLDITPGLKNITAKNCRLYLIDLHRAQIRHKTPDRWVIKDLAALYFSSKNIGLTTRDFYRFMQLYRERPLRDILREETYFWQKVKERGEQLYRDHRK